MSKEITASRKVIVTTVGTSMFTNYREHNENELLSLKILENKQCSDWGDYDSDINSTRTTIRRWFEKEGKKAAAEIKSILKLKGKFGDIKVVLLATDTILSVIAAQLLEEYFTNKGIDCEFCESKGNICACENVIKGLQVQDSLQFERKGIINLVKKLSQLIKDYGKDEVVFNITGGYKATIPYITLMGQIYRIPTYYIFEDTDDLIKIPQAPVDFDFSIIDENYFLFREIDKKVQYKDVSNDEKEVIKNLKKAKLVDEKDGYVSFTPLGLILYERFKELYESGKYHKRNLLSKVVELKLFKYLVYKYAYNKHNKVRDKSSYIVEHGKKVGDNHYDIDVYLESEKEIKAIEVKPAGSVSVFCNKEKGCTSNSKDSIEYKFRKGGFKFLIGEHHKSKNSKKLYFDLFLYYTNSVNPRIKGMLNDLKKRLKEEGIVGENNICFRIFFLKLPSNYTHNEHWEITGNNILDFEEKRTKY